MTPKELKRSLSTFGQLICSNDLTTIQSSSCLSLQCCQPRFHVGPHVTPGSVPIRQSLCHRKFAKALPTVKDGCVAVRAQKLLFVVVLAVVTASLAAWLFLRRGEPVYNGKPLTAWAQQYGSNNWSGRKELAREAEFAVRQIGTSSIPILLDLMRARDSDLTKRLRKHLSRKWHDALHLNDNLGRMRRIGAHGLAALGTNASAAVPALIDLATRHPDEDGRYIAVFALRTLGPAAETAIPFYVQCLTNQDNTIRNEAAVGLVRIPERIETTLPALLQYLETIELSSGWELESGVGLIGLLGTNAKPAVPRLLSLLNHPQALSASSSPSKSPTWPRKTCSTSSSSNSPPSIARCGTYSIGCRRMASWKNSRAREGIS